MKSKIFVFIVFIVNSLQAQEVSEKELTKHREKVQKSLEKGKNLRSLDTLFASGKAYCIMKGTRKGIGGPSAYSVRTLQNPEAEEIFLTMEAVGTGSSAVYFWDMVFINHDRKIRFQNGTMDLENTIVDYDLFTDSTLNIAGMNKLVLLKGQPAVVVVPGSAAPAAQSKMVERNRSGMIQIFGNKIQQGGVHVGNIAKSTSATDGKVITLYTITLPDGSLVATARNSGATDHNWEVVTAKNSESHTVVSSVGKDDSDIVKFLIDNLYL